MVRLAAVTVAAFTGLLLAGCYGGSFGQAGLSLPTADSVQTVSDAADSLVAHRTSASQNAKSAIGVTDALGSFVREINADQRTLASGSVRQTASVTRRALVQRNGKHIASISETLLRPRPAVTTYCQSAAGYSVTGIPSLDETFGWESGAYAGGTRSIAGRGLAIWSARASGSVVQGAIGGLGIGRGASPASCPMQSAAFVIKGALSANAFELPISLAFRRGELLNVSVADARFANGETLSVTTANRQPVTINGVIASRGVEVARFRTNTAGDGTLTITSSGAQYVIADWIVVGT